MLFSRKEVAEYVNNAFEPVWESVRPVPIINIDFGNGTKLTRTLNGNIATYVCQADGTVLDVLPGLYEPKTYVSALKQLAALPGYLDQEGRHKRQARLVEYHAKQAHFLTSKGVRGELIDVAAMAKARVEGGTKYVLREGTRKPAEAERPKPPTELTAAEDLSSWAVLAEDTRVNETQRRLLIHTMLAEAVPVQPANVAKRIYKEVLNVDLDDPHLGLGKVLFDNYPFGNEERH